MSKGSKDWGLTSRGRFGKQRRPARMEGAAGTGRGSEGGGRRAVVESGGLQEGEVGCR